MNQAYAWSMVAIVPLHYRIICLEGGECAIHAHKLSSHLHVLDDTLHLSGGGGGALCRLCKVPRTEDRSSQLHYHLPQW